MRESRRTLPGRGQTRRKFVETVNARDFLDEIDFALDFGAPGRLRAFPRREKRARRAAVLVDSNGRKTKRAEAGFNFLVGHVGAHDAKNFRARHADFFWRTLARKNVNDTGKQFASGKLKNQFRAAARGELRHFRIGAAAKTGGGFGVQFQKAGGAANGDGFEPGALDQNIFRRKRNFRFGAAHDSANAHGARAVAVANHADA